MASGLSTTMARAAAGAAAPHRAAAAAPRGTAFVASRPAARGRLQVCHADPDIIKRMGEKGIKLEGFDGGSHNPMAGMDFAKKLEERLTGETTQFTDGQGKLLSSDGSRADQSMELAYDPDNLLGKPEDNLINRRLAAKQASKEEEAKEEAKALYMEQREQLLAMRAARVVPRGDPAALAQFFFDTELNEMEYECTRCRPELTPEFFAHLDKMVSESQDEELANKYKALRQATSDYVKFLDANTQALAEPVVRMKEILEARDKKAKILEMVSNNQIDVALIALFQTNVNLAREAGQEEPAVFMEKVMNACKKYAML